MNSIYPIRCLNRCSQTKREPVSESETARRTHTVALCAVLRKQKERTPILERLCN